MVNTTFKKNYTKQEREECFLWFEQHMNELPQKLYTIPSMRFSDLPKTVNRMISVLRQRMGPDRTFNGEFSILLLIRKHLMENGIIKS